MYFFFVNFFFFFFQSSFFSVYIYKHFFVHFLGEIKTVVHCLDTSFFYREKTNNKNGNRINEKVFIYSWHNLLVSLKEYSIFFPVQKFFAWEFWEFFLFKEFSILVQFHVNVEKTFSQ